MEWEKLGGGMTSQLFVIHHCCIASTCFLPVIRTLSARQTRLLLKAILRISDYTFPWFVCHLQTHAMQSAVWKLAKCHHECSNFELFTVIFKSSLHNVKQLLKRSAPSLHLYNHSPTQAPVYFFYQSIHLSIHSFIHSVNKPLILSKTQNQLI